MQSDLDGMTQALDNLVEWMNENGAASFVAKLRPPASAAALDAAEAKVGAPLGDALRALYRWPFAVHLGTHRVIRITKGDYPWLRVVAPDLPTFVGDYASRVWAGDTSLPGVEQEGLAFLGRHLAPRD